MAVFAARAAGGRAAPDGVELQEMRFVADGEWQVLPCARWLPAVLRAVFAAGAPQFAPAAWTPPER
jgi:hypothetical protein